MKDGQDRGAVSSRRSPLFSRLGLFAYGVAILVVALDQASKAWFLGLHLCEQCQIPVLSFFSLTRVQNTGVSFGMLRADDDYRRWGLIVAAGAVVIFLCNWIRRTDRPLLAVAVGLVIGGALGNNLIDRVRLRHVTDFLDFSGLHFPWVFNVADSAITVGVILLLWDAFFPGAAAGKGRPPTADA